MFESQKDNPDPLDVLVLAAHPDDETLGCGATIARLSNEGHNIHLMTFTDGVDARDKKGQENRNKKLGEISEILGITSYSHGDFPDNQMDTIPLLSLCKYIEKLCNCDPHLIFTHHKNCNNIDHQLVNKATLTAFRPQYGKSHKIFSYFVPSSTDYAAQANFNGNYYFDAKGFLSNKLDALKIYDEEMRAPPHTRSYQNVENLMKVWGAEVGLEYAEKFELVRSVV